MHERPRVQGRARGGWAQCSATILQPPLVRPRAYHYLNADAIRGSTLRAAIALGLLLGLGLSPAARAEPLGKISTCFEEYLAPLALCQLEEAASLCDQIIKD